MSVDTASQKSVDECAAETATRPQPDADATSAHLELEPFTRKGDCGAAAGGAVHRNTLAFAPITAKNVGQLRVLNRVCFPLSYHEPFYARVLSAECAPLSFYACDGGDVPVGAISCRPEDGGARVYIMTLCVLQAYRRLGVGAALLEELLRRVRAAQPRAREIALHVHTPNDGAVAFYQHYGFETVETVPDYYSNIEPKSAFYLRKTL